MLEIVLFKLRPSTAIPPPLSQFYDRDQDILMDIDVSFSLTSLVELFNRMEIKSDVQPTSWGPTMHRGNIKRSPRCRPFPSPISSRREHATDLSNDDMHIDSNTEEDDIEFHNQYSLPSSKPQKLFRTIQFTQENYSTTSHPAPASLSKGPAIVRRYRLPLQPRNQAGNLPSPGGNKLVTPPPQTGSKKRFKIPRLTPFAR
ncbi:10062_t:CDS:1 [Acaulospora colombiana]|uniref:10062_t:CDS:1 n=1 Tax=Acaulospora colombiana TaxID=27376 RepID=A0ACA9MPB3_9GLOM|nr:10062_t:CDS:1 [Acaulospora colombiana]